MYSFKRLFLAYAFCAIPFSILGALLTLFNVVPVEFNGVSYYGLTGVLIISASTLFFALIFGVLNWITLNFGNYLYEKVMNTKSSKQGDKTN
jgi:hypothetical protein